MYKRRILQASVALILVLTLACGVILKPSVTPTSPLPTPSPEFIDLFSAEAPTPVATMFSASATPAFVGAKVTDIEGQVIIQSSDPALDLRVRVKDDISNSPLEEIQIQVYLVDNNSKILVIALDPNQEYLPLSKIETRPVTHLESVAVVGVSSGKAQAGVLILLLTMLKFRDLMDTGSTILEFYRDMPIREYSFWYQDFCYTGPQLATHFKIMKDILIAFVPGVKPLKALEEQMIEAVLEISTHLIGQNQDAENYLRSLPGRYLFRIHRFPKPSLSDSPASALSLIGIEYLGNCENSTSETDVTKEASLVQIGFYNSIYLRYDPQQWEAVSPFPDRQLNHQGETIETLRHRTIPNCDLHENLGHGVPLSWQRLDADRVIGSLEYRVETWTDTAIQKLVLIVYQYPAGESGYGTRIELTMDMEADQCIQSAEDVLALSEDLISKRNVPPNSGIPALPLDRKSIESVIQWVSYALANEDISVFENLITGSEVGYGTGMAGGRDQITREQFLHLLSERLINHPICEGYLIASETHLGIWTSAWEPDWIYQGRQEDALVFTFWNNGEGFSLVSAYSTPGPAILSAPSVDGQPCPMLP